MYNIDKERYDRQIRVSQIGNEGQAIISQKTVLIVGCGALGTYATEQLTRTGIKKLILVDFDKVEKSNLQRQTLFETNDIGKPKVLAARDKLLLIREDLEIEILQEKFDSAIFKNLGPIDLVLDCTDNFLARQLINEFCLNKNIPFIFTSAAGTSGQVMALHPQVGPCLTCLFPQLDELGKNCETIGVITPIIPLVSSLQISLALQIFIEPQKVEWETIQIVESWPISISKFTVKKQAHCASCGKKQAFKSQFNKTCGGIFSAYTSGALQTENLIHFFQNQNGQIQENPLAFRVKIDKQEITIFHKGKLLFYNFTEENARKMFERIENL